jgi:hypothetical protein
MSDQFGFIRSKDVGSLRTEVITKSSRSTPETDSSLAFIENGIREILETQHELLRKLDTLGRVGGKLETEHTDSEAEQQEEATYNLTEEQRQELQNILTGSNHEAQDNETTDDSADTGGQETGPDESKG